MNAGSPPKNQRECFEAARENGRQPSMVRLGLEEIGPGLKVCSNADIDASIRATSATAHHPAGTCKMGVDELAVVDPQLRVKGVDRLRVIDASVMPDRVGGNINAPVMMIAERASDLIRGHDPLSVSNASGQRGASSRLAGVILSLHTDPIREEAASCRKL